MTPDILALIVTAAEAHRIEPELVAAFVMTESSGNPKAMRFEPGTWRYVDVPDALRIAVAAGVTQEEEIREQMTSWGLMQVMGFNMRLMGYRGPLQSLEAAKGLDLGCAWLKHIQMQFPGQVPPPSPTALMGFSEALACAYNHGSPARGADGRWVVQKYVDTVRGFYNDMRVTMH